MCHWSICCRRSNPLRKTDMTTTVFARPATRSKWPLRLFYVLLAGLVVSVLAFSVFKPIKVLPRVSLAPGFAFTNQTGAHKTSDDYRGFLTIYNFTHTHCDTGCPQTSPWMQALRAKLDQSTTVTPYALVTISVDPERDTPDALEAYAAQFGADQSNSVTWDWLAGDVLRTKYVVGGGFGVFYDDQPGTTDTVRLDPRYVLVDGAGIVRAEYRAVELNVERVAQDIAILADEIQNSQGAARLAYEAAHLFRCYP